MAKVRVYELANELGVRSIDLLNHLQSQGEFVRSASSTIEPPVVRKLRKNPPAKLGQTLARPQSPGVWSARKPSLGDHSTRRNPSRNPFASHRQPSAERDAGVDYPALVEASELLDTPVSVLKLAKAPRRSRGSKEKLPAADLEWVQLFMSLDAKTAWTAGPDGLRPNDARIAGECRDHGVTPDDLSIKIVGRSVGERLRQGEPVQQVAAALDLWRRAGAGTGSD